MRNNNEHVFMKIQNNICISRKKSQEWSKMQQLEFLLEQEVWPY